MYDYNLVLSDADYEKQLAESIESGAEVSPRRPESIVGEPVGLNGMSIDDMIAVYEELLIGCIILKSNGSADAAKPRYTALIDWLRTTDMYTAPASTQYHESFVGGLLTHSLRVYNEIVALLNVPKFSEVPVESAALSALCHDWCKIGLYETFNKNVKDDATGKWTQVTAFKHNQTGIPLGHGVASMFLLSKFVKLTTSESLAIRWHQGRWNVCREELNELQLANEKCPLVHLLQFADQLAITQY